MSKHKNLSVRMLYADTLFSNTIRTPNILAKATLYGFDLARLEFCLALVAEVRTLNENQLTVHGKQKESFENFDLAMKKIYKLYIRNLKITRIIFSENRDARIALMLDGDRKQSFGGWKNQACAFYGNLLDNKSYLEIVSKYNITQTQLETEYQSVQDLTNLYNIYQKDKGDAVQSTKNRDEKVDLMDKTSSEFVKICKIVFEDSPGDLVKLGIK